METLHKYYQRASLVQYPPREVFFAQSLVDLTQVFPDVEILTPKLRSPLKAGKPTQAIAAKICNMLEINKSVVFSTLEPGPTESKACHLEAIETMIQELRKRMPRQLNLYRHNAEFIEEQIWQPRYGVSAVSAKLQPMKMRRVTPQAFILVSKHKFDILEPWYVAPPKRGPKPNKKPKNKKSPPVDGARTEEIPESAKNGENAAIVVDAGSELKNQRIEKVPEMTKSGQNEGEIQAKEEKYIYPNSTAENGSNLPENSNRHKNAENPRGRGRGRGNRRGGRQKRGDGQHCDGQNNADFRNETSRGRGRGRGNRRGRGRGGPRTTGSEELSTFG